MFKSNTKIDVFYILDFYNHYLFNFFFLKISLLVPGTV